MATAFDPFWFFKMPLSGDVRPRINSPFFSPTFNFAGNADVEDRVVSEVASYGKQIGWLNELVIRLAEKKDADAGVLEKVKKAVAEIDEIKKTQASTVLRAAVDALRQLEASEPELYKDLVSQRAQAAASASIDEVA